MEDAMPALTGRQKARGRLSHAFESILDKMVPTDESVPLPGGRQFVEWEDLADEVNRTLVPMFLEERAALDAAAHADCGGRCPHCHSERVYLSKETRPVEVRTPHGIVVLTKQSCRCRQC